MAETLQAKRYAQAAFEIAREQNALDLWSRELAVVAALTQNDELAAILDNPKFPFESKKTVLDSQLQKISPLAKNLVYILTSQGQFKLLQQVAEIFQGLVDELRGVTKAEITTAVPISAAEKESLVKRLSSIIGRQVVIDERVDPNIIGGVIARVGGKIIDGSTRTKLEALKTRLEGAGL